MIISNFSWLDSWYILLLYPALLKLFTETKNFLIEFLVFSDCFPQWIILFLPYIFASPLSISLASLLNLCLKSLYKISEGCGYLCMPF